MNILRGNQYILTFGVRDATNNLKADLATAVNIIFTIKNSAKDVNSIAVILKSSVLTTIAVDTPSPGYVQLILSSADTNLLIYDRYYVGLEVQYPSGNNQETLLKQIGLSFNTINVFQDIVHL